MKVAPATTVGSTTGRAPCLSIRWEVRRSTSLCLRMRAWWVIAQAPKMWLAVSGCPQGPRQLRSVSGFRRPLEARILVVRVPALSANPRR